MTSHRADRSLPNPNTQPTIPVPRAGRILGMSRNASYAAAKDGRLPTVAISASRVVVVTAEFLEKYRLSTSRSRRVTLTLLADIDDDIPDDSTPADDAQADGNPQDAA